MVLTAKSTGETAQRGGATSDASESVCSAQIDMRRFAPSPRQAPATRSEGETQNY
jgi:hypothetical protein